MIDRLLVFANPEVQKLLNEEFIVVAADDWYNRRRKDETGKFFWKVASQGPRDPKGTQQGHYVLTAQGKLLGYNNHRGSEPRIEMIKDSLKKWEGLTPEDQRGEVPAKGEDDGDYSPELPEGAQIVKVHTRLLEQREGRLQKLAKGEVGKQAGVDHLWLRKSEVEELEQLMRDGGGEIHEWLALRITKFHLLDNTRGEPEGWKNEEIKEWTLIVGGDGKVEGKFVMNSADGKLGYEGTISGEVKIKEGVLTKFDLLVLGKHWGSGAYTHGERPGKRPLGQVFGLVDGEKALDRIAPQGMRWAPGYWSP